MQCSPWLCSRSFTFYPLYYPLSSLMSSLNLNHHLYADDTQLFYSFYPSDYDSTITHLHNALEHISSWMTANLLTLNSSKTEFLLIGNRQQLSKIQNTSLNTTHSARNLGFVFDEHLTLSDQISALSKSCYSHIRHVSVLIRPPDIICRRTYILPVFLLSFFFFLFF